MPICIDPSIDPITPPYEPGPSPIECDCESINRAIAAKQDKLTAGTGIIINGSVISSTGGGGGLSGVTRFNGRNGNVMPQVGDYTASMIRTGDGKTVQTYINEYNNSKPESAMSSTSTKAVQNRVVKAYVDAVDAKTLPPGGNTGDLLAKVNSTNYNAEWISSNNFMLKSVYDTNNNARVDKADVSYAVQGTLYKATMPNTNADTTLVVQSQVGTAGGVVPLDANRKILPEFLPDNITGGLTYGGIFNATTRVVRLTPAAKSILGVSSDTMTLQNSSQVPEGYPANAELFYVTTNPGTFASMDFSNGDWLISLGTEWQQLKNGNAVSSVNGKTGAVVLNSDDVTEGNTNLYYPPADKAKLADIENQATRDINVIQTASVTTLVDGTKVLRLTNKNGDVTTFEGNAATGDYLTKTGNASSTYLVYTPTGVRDSFTGGELTGEFARKVVDWLRALETVAFTGDYADLTNRPTSLSQFINDGDGNNPFVTRTTTNLLNYYLKTETYTQQEIDNLLASVGSQNFIVVASLPVTDIDTSAIYYVPVDPADQTKGYNRYQYIQGRWIFLGTTDVSLNNYLEKTGNASNTTSVMSVYNTRELLAANDTLKEYFGKIQKWLSDLKEIAFDAKWENLDNGDELALKTELENYVPKNWDLTEAGKVLVIDADGTVVTGTASGEAVVRRGDGPLSVVGNDTVDDKINLAPAIRATAFGYNTIAGGMYQFVSGKYNVEDRANAYAEVVGIGDPTARMNGRTTSWDGSGWYRKNVSVGNTTDNVVEPVNTNDLTTKLYVDRTIDEKIADSGRLKKMVVSVVPAPEDASEDIIYLKASESDPNVYEQYTKILVSVDPEAYEMVMIGSTEIDLTEYQKKEPGDLDTTATSVSGAINELLGQIGDINDLETTEKTNLVAAINTLISSGDVIYKTMLAGETVRSYADGTKGAYVLSVPAGVAGNPSSDASTIISIPTPDKGFYYQFAMSGNVALYFRRQIKQLNAELNWQQLAVESIQQTSLPEASAEQAGKMYQYTGAKTSKLTPGKFYACKNVTYYAWLGQSDSKTYYTLKSSPQEWDPIYNSSFSIISTSVASVSGNTLTAKNGNRYTRLSQSDTTKYEWQAVTEIISRQDILDMVYPVGSIYIATHSNNPHTFLGGTWTIVGSGRVLWGVGETTGAGGTLDEQLPDIRGHIDWASGGQAKTEISSGSGAFELTNKNLGAAYPTGSGSSNAARGFDFRASYYNSVYKLNASVRPNAYTVHFWRRTA